MVEGERGEEVVTERMDLWDLSGKEGREAGRLMDFFGTLAPPEAKISYNVGEESKS